MKLFAKISAIFGAAAIITSIVTAGPAQAGKMKPTLVHSHTRITKSGKVVHVKSYIRGGTAITKKVVVHSYTRKTASGKTVHVKSFVRHIKIAKPGM